MHIFYVCIIQDIVLYLVPHVFLQFLFKFFDVIPDNFLFCKKVTVFIGSELLYSVRNLLVSFWNIFKQNRNFVETYLNNFLFVKQKFFGTYKFIEFKHKKISFPELYKKLKFYNLLNISNNFLQIYFCKKTKAEITFEYHITLHHLNKLPLF